MSPRKLFINRRAMIGLALLVGASVLPIFCLNGASAQDTSGLALKPNGKIAFVYQHLYTINPDGTGQTQIVTSPQAIRLPSWSPDGSKIAFSRTALGSQDFNIFVVNADGSNIVQLTNTGSNAGVAWSPDGSKIAFGSMRNGNNDIWVMNADGANQVNLTPNTPAADITPTWSPDGSQIAFASLRDLPNIPGDSSRGFEIYTMNADGTTTAPTRLTNNQVSDRDVDWSPDGSKLAFTRRDINDSDGRAERRHLHDERRRLRADERHQPSLA